MGTRHIRGLGPVFVGLAALLWDGAAVAQSTPKAFTTLPADIGRDRLPAWLQANTDIAPASVVMLSGGMAMVLVGKQTTAEAGDRRVRVAIGPTW